MAKQMRRGMITGMSILPTILMDLGAFWTCMTGLEGVKRDIDDFDEFFFISSCCRLRL